MATSSNHQEEKAELDQVLSSEVFAKSPTSAKLLQFICKKYFEDKAGDLKEYSIGVEALGRPPDFDPTASSIVRVEVHRVREKLKKYYEIEGSDHPIRVWLQTGHYVPQFLRRAEVVPVGTPKTEAAHVEGAPNLQTNTLAVESPGGRPLPSSQIYNEDARVSTSRTLSPDAKWAATKRFWKALAVSGTVLVAIVVFAVWGFRRARTSAVGSLVPPSKPLAVAWESGDEIRILAGYTKDRYIDRAGRLWQTDRYYHGGSVLEGTRDFIARTSDPTMFRSARIGEFSYDIPLKPGTYELRLFFAEPKFGPATYAGGGESSRIFSVEMNGKPLLSDLDVVSQSGGTNVALVRITKDVSPAKDGYLHLRFIRTEDQPLVNALEIVPANPGKIRPVRLVAQDNSLTDHAGRAWIPDTYYVGGRLVRRKVLVAGTDEPDLFAGERYGRFDYSIPVASGKYAVTLYFSETYFGAVNSGSGGVGSRILDVHCNGVPLLTNFDIFKEAGGASRALSRTFHGLEPNAAGQLVVSFIPVKNYACVNALEVVDESE